MRINIAWLITASLLLSSVAHAEDCELGKQYLSSAQEQLAKSQSNKAADLLRRAIVACPSYDAYEAMGEVLGHSKNRRDWTSAADAFVAADALAATPKARAETLYQYAALLNDDGDPQNAYPLIRKAYALAPDRKDIAALTADIEKQVQVPTKHQIVRSFGLSVYKPLKTSTSGGGSITGADHRQVNIPINFEFNSVELNEQTRGNITRLAEELADPSLSKKQFVFVGHSDARGDERYNSDLSRRRAEVMRNAVVELQPTLAGRIDVEGRGSSEPINSSTGVEAMRTNRRLQVILK